MKICGLWFVARDFGFGVLGLGRDQQGRETFLCPLRMAHLIVFFLNLAP